MEGSIIKKMCLRIGTYKDNVYFEWKNSKDVWNTIRVVSLEGTIFTKNVVLHAELGEMGTSQINLIANKASELASEKSGTQI